MKIISLINSDRVALISDIDYDRVSKYRWRLMGDEKNGYSIISVEDITVFKTGNRFPERLSIFILNKSGKLIDHRDRNIFNNQRENLREATFSQNCINQDKRKDNTSGYKGVSWHRNRKKWAVKLNINKKQTHLGLFDNKILAAIAYDDAAILHFGEFAKLNFQLYGA